MQLTPIPQADGKQFAAAGIKCRGLDWVESGDLRLEGKPLRRSDSLTRGKHSVRMCCLGMCKLPSVRRETKGALLVREHEFGK